MTRKRMMFIIVVWAVAVFTLIAIFAGPSLFSDVTVTSQSFPLLETPSPASEANPVSSENMLPGSTDWNIPPAHESTYQIQAYAGATSVAPRHTITFYASTQDTGNITIDIYRMGWYDGTGARLMQSITAINGENQGFYNVTTHQLVCPVASCPSPNAQTGLFEVHWHPSYTLTIPSNWVSGVYLAKFTDAKFWQTYVPFDVLGNPYSTYILVTPDTTAEAYNTWGGASLYEEDSQHVSQYQGIATSPGAGVQQVSFNRPYADGAGSGYVLPFELPTLRWLERQGYDVSYMSSTDLDQHPEQLLSHQAFLSIGHDEYWTLAMRQGVENAREHGVGLAFLGANTGYWQMRFEPGSNDRIITCDKVLASNDSATDPNDYVRDAEYGKDNTVVTSQWRDPIINRPENSLTGVMFSNLTHAQAGFAWTVASDSTSPLLANTGLLPGHSYGCGIVGYEWDRVWNLPNDPAAYKAATPKNIQILSSSRVIPHDSTTDGLPEYSNSAYYVAPSGAFIFASGSIYWGNALDDYRDISGLTQLNYEHLLATACGGNPNNSKAVPEIQKLMVNVMTALIVTHPSGHL